MKKLVIVIACGIIAAAPPKNTGASAGTGEDKAIDLTIGAENLLEITDLTELELTKENLLAVIKYFKIAHPEIVYKQAMLESGNLNSWLCRQHNNLFGMYQPSWRETASSGRQKHGYASFSHWTKSVEDYKLWQNLKQSETNYMNYLEKRGYSENEKYSKILSKIKLPATVDFRIKKQH